jgi:hypothetical protein
LGIKNTEPEIKSQSGTRDASAQEYNQNETDHLVKSNKVAVATQETLP